MKDQNAPIDAIEEIIDREIDRHPHNRNLLEALRPVLAARRHILAHLQLSRREPFPFDPIRLRGGIPVMEQCPLFLEDDPLDDLAEDMISPITAGLPSLEDGLRRFAGLLREKKISLPGYFLSSRNARKGVLQSWSDTYGIPQAGMDFLLHQI
jgi:FdhE protein